MGGYGSDVKDRVYNFVKVFDIRDADGRSAKCLDHHFKKCEGSIRAFQFDVNSCSETNQEDGRWKMEEQLKSWRDSYTFKDAAQEMSRGSDGSKFTVGILFSGGLLDTFAAVRSGFKPIWGCERNASQARMWTKFTGTENLGDVFGPEVLKAKRPMYIKSGAPCPNYSLGGNHLGSKGLTGWMFVQQADVIKHIQPWVFCLEMSDNALFVNEGQEVADVKTKLSDDYIIKSKVIRLWQHGDCSNRTRLFMVGFHKDLGQAAYDFYFPRGGFSSEKFPSARDIAVSDDEVPSRYWRTDQVPLVEIQHPLGQARLTKIGSKGDYMGLPYLPNAVYSWDGLLNGQTTLNGGGRRPTLDWKHGEAIGSTRLCVPIETVRAASLPFDYEMFATSFADGDPDDYLRLCVNNGVPIRTGVAIDSVILKVLQIGLHRLENPGEKWASIASFRECIRSMLFDTGANGSLNHRDVEQVLISALKSTASITVADGNKMVGSLDGELQCMVVNTANHKNISWNTPFRFKTTTINQLNMELLSFDEFYRSGWGCHLRPLDVDDGLCEIYRPKREGQEAASVPLRYDWDGGGGFYLDYILKRNVQSEHKRWLTARFEDAITANNAIGNASVKFYDFEQTKRFANDITTRSKDDVVETIIGQIEGDFDILGVKAGLRTDKQRLTEQQFHELFGHIGFCPNCKVCRLSKGSARRIKKKVNPHREKRPGHTWSIDTCTLSDRSEQGNKFLTIARCEATNMFKFFYHYLKSDIRDMLEEWIESTRSDQAFHNCGYKMISVLKLDNAGEWSKDSEKWQAIKRRLGIDCVYSCPDRKESAAHAERSVGIVEVVIKSMIFQAGLPPSYWQYAADLAEFILNRFPVTSQSVSVPMDGDRSRPIENYTSGYYDRRQIDRELSYFVGLGCPCLVQTMAKGSAIKPKTRWGICIGQERDQPVFMCPYTKAKFRSKSFTAFRLRQGLSFIKFLGLKNFAVSRASDAIPDDFNHEITVRLQGLGTPNPEVSTDLVGVKNVGDCSANAPIVTATPNELGGSVQVIDTTGRQLNLVPDSIGPCANVLLDDGDHFDLKRSTLVKPLPLNLNKNVTMDSSALTISYVDLRPSHQFVMHLDSFEACQAKTKAFVTKVGDSFTQVCKCHQLPFEQHNMYRKWLISLDHTFESSLPRDARGAKFKEILTLPYPTGSKWRKIIDFGSRKRRRASHLDIDSIETSIDALEDWIQQELSDQKVQVRSGGKYVFNIKKSTIDIENINAFAAKRHGKKKKRTKAVGVGKEAPPANTQEALLSEHAIEWVKSLGNEFYGLVDMGVLDLGYTKQQLHDIGIHSKPVPLGEYYEHKYGEDGTLTKRKTRIPVQGHPGNMFKGVHYKETFSATPKESSAKLLCALVVLLDLKRLAFDIIKAYCWADLPPGELIALKYPSAFAEFCPHTGEELFIVMRKNLYGHPSAGRTFGKARDKVILQKFNCDGWTCTRCRMDPCMFYITRSNPKSGNEEKVWMLAHVDDCDAVGTSQWMLDQFHEVIKSIWGIEVVSPDFMLGIRRRVNTDAKGVITDLKIDMIPFVEGMVDAFKSHLPTRKVVEPVSKGYMTSKMNEVDEDETKSVLQAGFQTAVGMALWASRHVFPECRVGMSMICRVMSKPSWKDFNELMQMIKWMDQSKSVGITYTAGINEIPLWLVDASNKPDPADGKCQYGEVCMFMGGSILEKSRKLKHIGLSSQHNEYMAMAFANQSIVWLRQLLMEMSLESLVSDPTLLLADNRPANTLSVEDIVTSGNQYIYLPYHYNKEVQEMKFSEVAYVKSLDNISDLTTKCVDSATLKVLWPAITGQDHTLIKKLMQENQRSKVALNVRIQLVNDDMYRLSDWIGRSIFKDQ